MAITRLVKHFIYLVGKGVYLFTFTSAKFSVLNVIDFTVRVVYLIGFLMLWLRLGMMEKRGNRMMEDARFERQMLANALGIDLAKFREESER